MIYTITTDTPLQQVKDEMVAHAKEAGFGVLGSYEFQQILESKGFPIEREITGFELCSPKAAQQALTDMPEISVYLPCRISVYEENGKTVLSTINVSDIMGTVEASDAFKEHMRSVYEKFVGIMKSWN